MVADVCLRFGAQLSYTQITTTSLRYLQARHSRRNSLHSSKFSGADLSVDLVLRGVPIAQCVDAGDKQVVLTNPAIVCSDPEYNKAGIPTLVPILADSLTTLIVCAQWLGLVIAMVVLDVIGSPIIIIAFLTKKVLPICIRVAVPMC